MIGKIIGESQLTRYFGDKKKELVLIIPKGQHSNGLILNLNFEAFCMEYGIEYRNPIFTDADFYVNPCSTETDSFTDILRIRLLGPIFCNGSLVKKYFTAVWLISRFGFAKYIFFGKEMIKKGRKSEEMLLKAFEKKDTVYVGGFGFRVINLLEKHRDELIRKYSLKPIFYEENDFCKNVMRLKQEGYTLIGVHIRRGDYKKWRGGRHYFEDEVYEKYMKCLDGENRIFIIFSSDNVKFKESEKLLISKEKWYIDHHVMSLCDYLIGPPSSFSLWAAFMGKNKFYHIVDKNKYVTLQDFSEFKHWEF
jgi:hypothetical protein